MTFIMKNIFFISIILTLISCSGDTYLDKPFSPKQYEYASNKLVQDKLITPGELCWINYTILRQRDYYNYEVEGKSYRELLELSKKFRKEGMPVNEAYTENGDPSDLTYEINFEGIGAMKTNAKSSRVQKSLNFECTFKNNSKKDIAIQNTTFHFNGPFKKLLTAATYEVNCLVKANKQLNIKYFVSAKDIHNNLLFDKNYNIKKIWIDSILYNTDIRLAGNSIDPSLREYHECNHGGNRIQHKEVLRFTRDLKDKDWKKQNADGSYELNYGPAHFVLNESDEPVEM